MTYQPGDQPYTQPQDPWSGAHGTASAPTEPLPAPARGSEQFAPGVASPVTWSQETIAHSDPVTSSRPEGSRAGLYVFVGLLVVVLGGAGGYASWWMTSRYAEQLGVVPPTSTSSTETSPNPGSPTPEPTERRYHPLLVNEGTCLVNKGTQNEPEMWVVGEKPCDRPGSYEVLRVVRGGLIPEFEDDNFTDETARQMCEGVPSDAWFGWNHPVDDSQDAFYCLRTTPDV